MLKWKSYKMIINTKATIYKPREEVWKYFTNTDHLPKWIGGLEEYHHLSGKFGEEGSTGLYKFREDGKVVEMREEIIAAKKNEEHTGKFYHKHFDMIINNTFIKEDENTTTFICNTEYRFRSFKWKLISKLFLKNKLQKRQNDDIRRLKKAIELTPIKKKGK